MDGVFTNLVRGSRLRLYMGIDQEVTPGRFSQDYTSISFGVEVVGGDAPKKPTKKAIVAKGKAAVEEPVVQEETAEFLLRVKCGHLTPRKYRIAVDCSPALVYTTLSLHYPRSLEPGDDGELLIRARAPANTDFSVLGQCVRLSQYL